MLCPPGKEVAESTHDTQVCAVLVFRKAVGSYSLGGIDALPTFCLRCAELQRPHSSSGPVAHKG